MEPLGWNELLIVFAAVSVGGLVKGVTGLGLPLIAVPVIAGTLGVERAVVLMIIPGIVLNSWQAWSNRQFAHEIPELLRVLAWGVPGAAIGASVLYLASDRVLETVLAACISAYLLLRYLRPEFRLKLPTRHRLAPVVGFASGALQASTGISAPVIASYMHALRLRPHAYVFSVAVPFGTFSAAHCVMLNILGVYTLQIVTESLLAVVPAVTFIAVGEWLRRFIQPSVFDVLIRILLVLIALRLLYLAWLQP